jgi:amino acid adenylation domain-containing protein/non-ribosomal peptide synthase protein (TIGR01720 family)
LPRDFARGPNSVESARTVTFGLTGEQTRALLVDLPQRLAVGIEAAVLAALVRVLARFTGSERVKLALERFGRDALNDIDVSRTVGWFTTLFPVALDAPASLDMLSLVSAIAGQLRLVPDGGHGYGLLRYGADEAAAAALRDDVAPEVLFNYFGQIPSATAFSRIRYSARDVGALRAGRLARAFLVEINCRVQDGRLICTWEYSDHHHRASTIEDMSRQFLAALDEVVRSCAAPPTVGALSDAASTAHPGSTSPVSLTATADIVDAYPLSPIQSALLMHHLQSPGADAYFEQSTFTVEGELNLDAFQRACDLVMDRHAILRSCFAWKDRPHPVQIERPGIRFPLTLLDWRAETAEEQARALDAFVAADRGNPFDVQTAPLLRLTLIRLARDRYACVCSYHHLLLDAWSLAVAVREILAHYGAIVAGGLPVLAPARQYREYVEWLQAQDGAVADEFWASKLHGWPGPTPLPGDRGQRVSQRRIADVHESCHLSRADTDALVAMAREHRVTLNTIVQAAWALLLSRWSGRNDICYGVTVSCRPAALGGAEDMIGVFVNTVPMRTRLLPAQTIRQWLAALGAELSDVIVHAVTPLADIHQRWGRPGEPLFDSVVVFQNHPRDVRSDGDVRGLRVTGGARFDRSAWPLMLVVEPGEELRLEFVYDDDRFDRTLIRRLLAQLRVLLHGIAAAPGRRVETLPAWDAAEAHQVVIEWNDTATSAVSDVCYHQLFEAQAARTPEALAVASSTARLTYGELNARANQIAWCLRDLGTGVESRVGVCLGRSTDLVAARLAVLKAGAAYVPLDPDLPPKRLEAMIAEAGAATVVTERRLRDRLPDPAATFCLDEAEHELRQRFTGNLEVTQSSANLAYVIFTSGSSGRPKGVATAHAGFVNLVRWHNAAYRVTAADRKSQLSGLGFDAAIWEMWPYLAAGASVHLPDDETRADWPRLREWLRANAITVCFLPTPLAEAVVDEAWPDDCQLRALLTGGDRLHAWPRRPLQFDFVNKYGPTEVTAVTTWAPFAPRTASPNESPPIGRPIANLQVYVLDASLRPVPAGAAGELFIGGIGLARGYFGRPDLTAERFLPNPFGTPRGSRVYRTGDLVRWSNRGQLEFLGRIDGHIKLRGFRIEPGEIEAALTADPNIRSAAVVPTSHASGVHSLTAYLIVADGREFSADATHARLRRTLPAYMLASRFVVLDEFPLTPNGKVDYRALAARESAPAVEPTAPSAAPATQLEQDLADIWRSLLQTDRVGVHDDFFALGGDSILAIRVSALAGVRGIRMSPAQLFEFPTIAALAARVQVGSGAAEAQHAEAVAGDAVAELSERDLAVLADTLSDPSR